MYSKRRSVKIATALYNSSYPSFKAVATPEQLERLEELKNFKITSLDALLDLYGKHLELGFEVQEAVNRVYAEGTEEELERFFSAMAENVSNDNIDLNKILTAREKTAMNNLPEPVSDYVPPTPSKERLDLIHGIQMKIASRHMYEKEDKELNCDDVTDEVIRFDPVKRTKTEEEPIEFIDSGEGSTMQAEMIDSFIYADNGEIIRTDEDGKPLEEMNYALEP